MQHYGNIRRILSYMRRAIDDYNMIENGDKIAVGVSGGKDSLTLLCALTELREFYPKKFSVEAIHLNLAFYEAGFCEESAFRESLETVRSFCESLDVTLTVIDTHISDIIFNIRKEKNPCSLCARMRRGALHQTAKSLGCNKAALGHHFDDTVETFLMNLFNESRLGCFSPVTYLDRSDITLIRPLLYCPEKEIRHYSKEAGLPVMTSPCPSDKDSERQRVKELIYQLDKNYYHNIKYRIFGAMTRAGIDGFHSTENLNMEKEGKNETII